MQEAPHDSGGARSVPIVLASGSPRRRELVERVGYDPRVVVSDIPEEIRAAESGPEYTERLAEAKAEDVASQLAGDEAPTWLLAADTIVTLDEDVLEKPRDAKHAREMLQAMSDRWHAVVTSFCWLDRHRGRRHVETVTTDVRLRELADAFIASYVATGEPMDKAGSYGIQDYGSLLVRRLRGSYFNVVGLPLCEVVEATETLGALEIHPLLGGESRRDEGT